MGELEGLAKLGGSLVGNQYGTITKRKVHNGLADATLTTQFQLFNTMGNGMSTISRNYKILQALQYNNLPDKTSVFTYMPPVIYEMEIPGVRYCPAAYIAQLVVENIGQVNRRLLTVDEKTFFCNIPDAWDITLSINEMLPESRNIFEGISNRGSKIHVIEPGIVDKFNGVT